MEYIIFIERIVYCGGIFHKRSSTVNLMFSVYIKIYILMAKAKKKFETGLDEHKSAKARRMADFSTF